MHMFSLARSRKDSKKHFVNASVQRNKSKKEYWWVNINKSSKSFLINLGRGNLRMFKKLQPLAFMILK